jgi:hypothetical protein
MMKGVLSEAASSSSNTSAGRRKIRELISLSTLGDENNEFFHQTIDKNDIPVQPWTVAFSTFQQQQL